MLDVCGYCLVCCCFACLVFSVVLLICVAWACDPGFLFRSLLDLVC